MRVHIYGPIDGPTGYDEITRNLIFGLYSCGYDITVTPYKTWSPFKVTSSIKPLIDYIVERGDARPPEVSINVCLPTQAIPYGHCLNVLYSMFEADRIPVDWVTACNNMDLVIVPTEFCKKSWIRCGVNPHKLRVVNIGVDTGLYNKDVMAIDLFSDNRHSLMRYKYRFLNIQEVTARKNLEGLLSAWELATKDPEFPVNESCLMLKLNSYTGLKLRTLRELLATYSPKAPVFLTSRIVPDQALPKIYQACTHYITMSRGEGWGLSEHKAGLMGKTVIAPRSTSFTTFLNDTTAFMIPTKRVPCTQGGVTSVFYNKAFWYEPDVTVAAKLIVESTKDTTRGSELSKVLTQDYHIGNFVTGVRDQFLSLFTRGSGASCVKLEESSPQVLHYCTTFGEECGIANYTKGLYNKLQTNHGEQFAQMIVSGPDCGLVNIMDSNQLSVLHLHLEYQFMSPARIRYLCKEAALRGVSVVVTMHTINKAAVEHHAAISEGVDCVVVQTDKMRDEFLQWGGWTKSEDAVKVIPLGCDTEGLVENRFTPGSKRFVVGFFGFSYFHKGLDKLILAMSALKQADGRRFFLRAFSKKPNQDKVNFSEHCQWLINTFNAKDNVYLNSEYQDEKKIIQYLQACNVVVLPYSDYGGIGASAAIRTVLKAGTPVIVSDSPFFSDIPEELAPRLSNTADIAGDLVQWAEHHSEDRVKQFIKQRNKFVEKNSLAVVAKRYLDVYRILKTDGA